MIKLKKGSEHLAPIGLKFLELFESKLRENKSKRLDIGKVYFFLRTLVKDISKQHRKYARTQYKYSAKHLDDGKTHFLNVLEGWEIFNEKNMDLSLRRKTIQKEEEKKSYDQIQNKINDEDSDYESSGIYFLIRIS